MFKSTVNKDVIKQFLTKHGLDGPTILFLIAFIWSVVATFWILDNGENIYVTQITKTVRNGDASNEVVTYDFVSWSEWGCEAGDLFSNFSPTEEQLRDYETWHQEVCTNTRTTLTLLFIFPYLATLVLYRVGLFRWMMVFAFLSAVVLQERTSQLESITHSHPYSLQ